MDYKFWIAFIQSSFQRRSGFFALCYTVVLASGMAEPSIPVSERIKPVTSTQKDSARIAIIVNKDPITYQDIQDRARLVLLTSGMANTPEMLKTVEQQVKKSLVDEKIQLQAAKQQKIFISDAEIQAALKNIAKDNQMTSEQMKDMFKQQGINLQTLYDRLRAQIAWARTIREAFGALVQITEAEVTNSLNKMKENGSKDQYELMEIFLRVDNPAHQAQIHKEADKIYHQLQSGAHFHVIAQQFSESTSSAAGGYIGWFAKGQMDAAIEEVVLKLEPGEFSKPIRTNIGYKIVLLKDLKKSNQAAFGHTQITYRQVLVPYHDAITEEEYQKVETHITEMQQINTCDKLEAKAKECGYQCEVSDKVPLVGLPLPLQKLFRQAKVGQCLKPLPTHDHLIVTMVCSRTVPEDKLPSSEDVKQMLEQEKFSKIANREFNKLHAIAFIEDKTKPDA